MTFQTNPEGTCRKGCFLCLGCPKVCKHFSSRWDSLIVKGACEGGWPTDSYRWKQCSLCVCVINLTHIQNAWYEIALRFRPLTSSKAITDWWFGTFSMFPYVGKNHPNWLIFFRGVETTNQPLVVWKRRSFSQRLSLAALFQGFRRFSQRSGEMAADGQEGWLDWDHASRLLYHTVPSSKRT